MRDTVSTDDNRRIRDMMQEAGLRPTRQRMDLGELLFGGPDRHLTAEMLHEEAQAKNVAVSLATVYNNLHQFTEGGLLRAVAVCRPQTFFVTTTG